MGLDATVYCNCVETGQLTTPHPYPGLLYIDSSGCPEIRSDDEEKQYAHDQWQVDSPCRHEACMLVHHYIGNTARVANLRRNASELSADPEREYPIIWTKVIYSGTHCGDWLDHEQVVALEAEVQH